ncbi:sodium/hydrogen exchanger 9B2 isoform X3 [Patella vulgata]|uniref:sodium/hydrogen exchanger 9B2 isoform X3 n=1 Tax=Patella vulgata TaxID=6465 RepID=UPI00217FE25B|nr:sodium/hydrogen exchanger 9B2 isoform X3 [Patella vulgata]
MFTAARYFIHVNRQRRKRRKKMTTTEKGGGVLDGGKTNGAIDIDETQYHEIYENEIEYEIKESLEPEVKKCAKCRSCCFQCCRPIMADENPLPEKASCISRLAFALMCPPHGRLGAVMVCVLLFGLWYGVMYFLTKEDMLPGGNIFSLVVLFMACWSGGYIFNLIRLPALLGMLIVGCLLGNVPHINVADDIQMTWSIGARQIALAVILIRAGLGLDPKALKRLSFVVIRLAFSPCLMETITDGIVSHFLLGLPWEFGFMLGFVLAAVSPAVVVPSLFLLSDKGYGVDKGVPTLVIAAASIDDVLAITGFGVLLGIAFSKGDLVWTLFKGPLEALVGIVYGIFGGLILWYLPQKSSKHLGLFRCACLLAGGLFALFGSRHVNWSGAGPLGCLTLPFVAAFKWRQETASKQTSDQIEAAVGVLWMIFQPLLFGLIGAQVKILEIDVNTIGLGFGTLCIGLGIRMITSFLAVFGTDLTIKERFFIPFAWLPKATVQAAIGGVALDMATSVDNKEWIGYGKEILTIAVLSILLTAPIGSFMIAILGPVLLNRSKPADELQVEAQPEIEKEDSSHINDALSIDDENKVNPNPNTDETTRM